MTRPARQYCNSGNEHWRQNVQTPRWIGLGERPGYGGELHAFSESLTAHLSFFIFQLRFTSNLVSSHLPVQSLASTSFHPENTCVVMKEASMTSPEAGRSEPTDASAQDDFLLYDGECPFCSFYARKSGFRTQSGKRLTLIDANRAPERLAELRGQGCEVGEGMVLVLDGRRYQGADAMTALEAMTSSTGWFGSLSKWFASNPKRVRVFYPWLRKLRGVARWVKGRGARR